MQWHAPGGRIHHSVDPGGGSPAGNLWSWSFLRWFSITAALIFYSVGVWVEHLQRVLKWWRAGFFGLGLICDAGGTYLMSRVSASGEVQATGLGAGLNAFMTVTGAAALLLMVLHLVWAVIVLLRKDDTTKKNFHGFSLLFRGIWLIPYFTGAIGREHGMMAAGVDRLSQGLPHLLAIAIIPRPKAYRGFKHRP